MTPEKALFWMDWINICILTCGAFIIYAIANLFYRLWQLSKHLAAREKAMFTSPYFLNQVEKLTPEARQKIFGEEVISSYENNRTR